MTPTFIGIHGAENTDFYILALAKYDIDIQEKSKNISEEENIDHDLHSLIEYNKIHKKDLWEKISSINPYGLTSLPQPLLVFVQN